MQKITTFVGLALLVTLAGCVTMPKREELATVDFGTPPANYEQSIPNYMAARLKDPMSATYRFGKPRKGFSQDGWAVGGKKHYGYIVVAYINAKNSYGGYVGEEPSYFLFFDKDKIADITESFTGPATMAMYVDTELGETPDAHSSAPLPASTANQTPGQGKVDSTAEKEPGLIKKFSGTDMTTTRPFTAPDKWEIQWDAQGPIFSIILKDGQGNLLGVVANQTQPGKGSAYQPKGGQYIFEVNAVGPWVIRAVNAND